MSSARIFVHHSHNRSKHGNLTAPATADIADIVCTYPHFLPLLFITGGASFTLDRVVEERSLGVPSETCLDQRDGGNRNNRNDQIGIFHMNSGKDVPTKSG